MLFVDYNFNIIDSPTGRLTYVYEYDETGRLVTVVAPTGTRVGVDSWMGGEDTQRSLSVGVGGSQGEKNAHILTLTGNARAVFTQSECYYFIFWSILSLFLFIIVRNRKERKGGRRRRRGRGR